MTQQIPLTRGYVALVDDADYDTLHRHTWFYSETGYAIGFVPVDGRYSLVHMHELICLPAPAQQIAHLNGDKLDNRRTNLRVATPRQNGLHGLLSGTSETKLRGVGWHKGRRRYHARIQLQGIRVHLGFFDDPVTAALAYDAAARRLFEEMAVCNYPERATPRPVALLVARKLKQRHLDSW